MQDSCHGFRAWPARTEVSYRVVPDKKPSEGGAVTGRKAIECQLINPVPPTATDCHTPPPSESGPFCGRTATHCHRPPPSNVPQPSEEDVSLVWEVAQSEKLERERERSLNCSNSFSCEGLCGQFLSCLIEYLIASQRKTTSDLEPRFSSRPSIS